MHVLIIPSEEFVPAKQPLAGIFQYHQAVILNEANYTVGVISVSQEFSVFMFIKAICFKCFKIKTGNSLDHLSFKGLLQLAYKKIFKPLDFLRIENLNGIEVFRIEGMYYLPPSIYNNIFGWINAGLVAYDAYVKKMGRPDIIHAHNALYAGILAAKIKAKYNVNYIITEHSTFFARDIIKKKSLIRLVANSYKNAEGAFAVSQPFCDLLSAKFIKTNFSYLPNVIDPLLEKEEYGSKAISENEFVFLNIAELHPKKNQQLLIRAFAELSWKVKNLKLYLWIAGEGVEHDNLNNLINVLGVQESVRLLGVLDRKQIVDSILKSNCLVLSSNFETFGVVLIEALLFGKPVISTKCGGPEGFINAEVGMLVEKEDEKKLSSIMHKMVIEYKRFNQDKLREFAISEFGKEKFLKRIDSIYINSKAV